MSRRITRARWQQILAQAREGATVEINGHWVARRVVRRPTDLVAVVTGAGQHGAAWQMDLAGRLQGDVFDAAGGDEDGPRLSLEATWIVQAALGALAPRVAADQLSPATWPALRDQQQERRDDGTPRWKPCVAVADHSGRPEVLIDAGSDLARLISWMTEAETVFVAPMDAVERLAALWAQALLEDPDADPMAVLAVHAVDELALANEADRLAAGVPGGEDG